MVGAAVVEAGFALLVAMRCFTSRIVNSSIRPFACGVVATFGCPCACLFASLFDRLAGSAATIESASVSDSAGMLRAVEERV